MPDNNPTKIIQYKDTAVRIILTLIGAFIVTEFGGNEPLLSELVDPTYYLEFGATLAITLLDTYYIYRLTLVLDRRYDWMERPAIRAILQLLLGVLVPVLVTFLLAALYFRAYGMSIIDAHYHLYALPFIAVLIGLFNVYYLVLYLYHWGQSRVLAQAAQTMEYVTSGGSEDETVPAGRIIVHTPTGSRPYDVESIAYFYRSGGKVFLQPFNGDYQILSQSLEYIETKLDANQFFMVARHMLANKKAILSYFPLEYGKLGLELQPKYKGKVNVSKIKAARFREWFEQ